MGNNDLSLFRLIFIILDSFLSVLGYVLLDEEVTKVIMLYTIIISIFIDLLFCNIRGLNDWDSVMDIFLIIYLVVTILGFLSYKIIIEIQLWVNNWPLPLKIVTPIVIITIFIGLFVYLMYPKPVKNKDDN